MTLHKIQQAQPPDARVDIERIGKHIHESYVGKVLRVIELRYYQGNTFSSRSGVFLVRISKPSRESLKYADGDCTRSWGWRYTPKCWNLKKSPLYLPEWDCEPLPNQGLPANAMAFWCTPITYDAKSLRWSFHFEQVDDATLAPPQKKYAVRMSATARVRGTYRTQADSPEHAEALAKEHSGDVSWKYEGADDDSIEVDSVEEDR